MALVIIKKGHVGSNFEVLDKEYFMLRFGFRRSCLHAVIASYEKANFNPVHNLSLSIILSGTIAFSHQLSFLDFKMSNNIV